MRDFLFFLQVLSFVLPCKALEGPVSTEALHNNNVDSKKDKTFVHKLLYIYITAIITINETSNIFNDSNLLQLCVSH